MLFCGIKYLNSFAQKKFTGLLVLMFLAGKMQSQTLPLLKDSSILFSTLAMAENKKPARLMVLKTNTPAYKKYVVKRGGELMRWPSYPLTTGQIIARNEDWLRRNSTNIGEQIASDIIKSNVNRLIYGRKPVPAAIPKF